MPALIAEYEADNGSVSGFYDLPWSTLRFDRVEKHHRAWLVRLGALDFESLSQPDRVDYVLLRNTIQAALAGIARERALLKTLDRPLAFRGTIHELEIARWRGEPVDGRAAASRVSDLARAVEKLKARVERGPKPPQKGARSAPATDETTAPVVLSPELALKAAAGVSGLKGVFRRWYEFHEGRDPELSWWLKRPCEDADRQLEEYAKQLREEIAGQKGKDDDPLAGEPVLGPEALAESIRLHFLPYTAAELIAIGERELAWCERELKAASRRLGCGEDWKAALAKVKADHESPGKQSAWVFEVAREATAFVKRHAFVTVPPLCEETWRVTMLSPEAMKTVPYAAYGDHGMLVAYATQGMSQEDKLMAMRGNNRAFTHAVTPHELVPGHHLQAFVSERNNPHRHLFSTPFFVEGWGVYCELRLWDLGWNRTPQERIGALFWRMTRAARIVVSLRYHLGQMKPQEMVDFLVGRVGHEKAGATSEVRRFITAMPLYQASYLLGGLQLKALHDEVVPGRMSERQYSDAVLAQGAVPIEMVRAALLGVPLTRDAAPAWRFAGSPLSGR